MKKRLIALALVLVLIAASAPAALAGDGGDSPAHTPSSGIIPGGESGGDAAGTDPGADPGDEVVVPGGESGGDSGGTTGGGSGYTAPAPKSSNPVLRFLNSIADWFRQRFAPWVANVALPWLSANWKTVAIVCVLLIIFRIILAITAKSRRRRRREAAKDKSQKDE